LNQFWRTNQKRQANVIMKFIKKRGFSLRWIEDFAEELYKVGDYATLTKSGCLLESVTCFVDEIRQKLVFEEPLPKKGKI